MTNELCMVSHYPGLVPRPRISDAAAAAAAAGGGGGEDRERAPIFSPTRTTVWSSNNPSCQI